VDSALDTLYSDKQPENLCMWCNFCTRDRYGFTNKQTNEKQTNRHGKIWAL